MRGTDVTRTLIAVLAALALSTGTAVAADAPDSVLIGGKVEVKLGDNQGNVLTALSTVYKLDPYAWETGTAFAVKTPEGKVVGTVAFDAKARVWWASSRLTDPRPALARVEGRDCRVITWNAGSTVGVDCGQFRVGHDAGGAFEEIVR
jgi:hypothetical protein